MATGNITFFAQNACLQQTDHKMKSDRKAKSCRIYSFVRSLVRKLNAEEYNQEGSVSQTMGKVKTISFLTE